MLFPQKSLFGKAVLQEDACVLAPYPRLHPRRGSGTPGRHPGPRAAVSGAERPPAAVTALPHTTLHYENNVGLEVCPLSTKGRKETPISPRVRDHAASTAATPETQAPPRALTQDSSWCHTLYSSFVVLILKSHAGLLSRSQSMTRRPGSNTATPLRPTCPPALGTKLQKGAESSGRLREKPGHRAGKSWAQNTSRWSLLFYYSLLNKLSAKNIL